MLSVLAVCVEERQSERLFIGSASYKMRRSAVKNLRHHLCCFVLGFVACAPSVADPTTVAASNYAQQPPLIAGNSVNCSVKLYFKPVPFPRDDSQHAYLVITGPDGAQIEVRGGPSKGGPSKQADQPSGNPFQCNVAHPWGVVVPYIGKHGLLGKDAAGNDIYSPDGDVSQPTKTIPITKSAQTSMCALANCLMKIASADGKSCQLYTVGVGKLRNSNTLASMALASCGVKDPKPDDVQAPGWGEAWNPQ